MKILLAFVTVLLLIPTAATTLLIGLVWLIQGGHL